MNRSLRYGVVFATLRLHSPSFEHVHTSVDVAHRFGFKHPLKVVKKFAPGDNRSQGVRTRLPCVEAYGDYVCGFPVLSAQSSG